MNPDTATREIALYLTTATDANAWSSFGPTLRVRAVPLFLTPDGPRNPDADYPNTDPAAAALADLQCEASLDASAVRDYDDARLFGGSPEYRSPYRVDLARAEIMTATLRRIERHTDKVAAKYGPPDTFGAYLARFADAIGARAVIRYAEPVTTYHGDFQRWTPADLPSLCAFAVATFRSSLAPTERTA